MKIEPKQLLNKIAPLLKKLQTYLTFLIILAVLGAYGFLVWRINTYADTEPSEDAVAEKLLEIKRPKIDQSAVDRVLQLQDNSVDVQALFQQARDNPFQD